MRPSHRLWGPLPRIRSPLRWPMPPIPPSFVRRGYRATAPGNFPPRGAARVEGAQQRGVQDLDALTNSNVYSDVPTPGSAVEAIYENGFLFSNGIGFRDGSGALLVHNEAFRWQPTQRGSDVEARAVSTGILELGKGVWGMLDVVHPKPELLIVGTGRKTLLLSKDDRSRITEMGIRMDVMDTSHAASQYNLLATERPLGQIAAALLVDGFGAT